MEPALQKFTFETLTTRLFELMTLMQETASLGLEQRVAAFLLRRSVNGQALEVTHEQIAHHLGSSREVVSRGASQSRRAWSNQAIAPVGCHRGQRQTPGYSESFLNT